MRTRSAALAAAVLTFTALTTARSEAALHPGDKINVTVYNHPELSGSRTLDAAGNVSLPVVGQVAALNLETSDVANRVRTRLLAYVRKPAVDVQLEAQSESIFVAGGPNGVLRYEPGETLTSAVDQLQSTSPGPRIDQANAHAVAVHDVSSGPLDLINGPVDFHTVRIARDGRQLGPFDVLAMRGSGQTGPTLAPNDTIQLVNKPVTVDVAGDVERPGIAHLSQNEPLAQAINQVGGAAASSSQTNITLQRGGTSQVVTMGDPTFTQPAQNGDRIVVARAPRVDVLGSVTHPGDTLLRGNNTLVSAIYYAGGPSEFANLKSVAVVHNGTRTQYNLAKVAKGSTGDNPELVDGDVVFVPDGSHFRVTDLWSAIGSLGLFGLRI